MKMSSFGKCPARDRVDERVCGFHHCGSGIKTRLKGGVYEVVLAGKSLVRDRIDKCPCHRQCTSLVGARHARIAGDRGRCRNRGGDTAASKIDRAPGTKRFPSDLVVLIHD